MRRRGFGIHSPFAFDFVRRVIASHCRYYCYGRLAQLARRSTLPLPTLRLLFRLALFFRPTAYAVVGDTPVGLPEAIAEGAPHAERVEPKAATMLIVNAPVAGQVMGEVAGRQGVIVILNLRQNHSALESLWAITTRGMLFRGSRTAIFVARQHLPHQAFSLWI